MAHAYILDHTLFIPMLYCSSYSRGKKEKRASTCTCFVICLKKKNIFNFIYLLNNLLLSNSAITKSMLVMCMLDFLMTNVNNLKIKFQFYNFLLAFTFLYIFLIGCKSTIVLFIFYVFYVRVF